MKHSRSAEPSPRPDRVGPYRLERLLGSGGMGEVYRAFDERLDRHVAVKHIPDSPARDDAGRRRLRREARLVAKLNHPSIVQIHDIFEQDGGDWIVMEWVEGQSIQQLLDDGPLPLAQVFSLGLEIAEGLAEAHDKGIVHRDLKAENVMRSASGHAKILDFGLAKGMRSSVDESLTLPGEGVGTGRSAAPEQLLGYDVDHRSDLFSFGVLLYEMLAGQNPFLAGSLEATLARLCSEPHRPLAELRPDVPQELAALVDRLLSKDPGGRPRDCHEVADVLRHGPVFDVASADVAGSGASGVADGGPLPTRSRQRSTWRRAAPWLVGLALLLAVGWFTDGRWRGGSAPGVDPGGRPAVAMLGFHNLRQDSETAWMGTAIGEMLVGHLRAGDALRIISGERVAGLESRIRAFVQQGALPASALEEIRYGLGAEFAAFGSYWLVDAEDAAPGELHLQMYLQDIRNAGRVNSWSLSGRDVDLAQMVAEAGRSMREALQLDAAIEVELVILKGTAPSDSVAAELYFRGLELLRKYDAQEARRMLEASIAQQDDFAPSHAALSRAWLALGFDTRAAESAERAHGLVSGLAREDALWIEGLFHETSGAWEQAVRAYGALWEFYPDNLEYGLRLATAQTEAGTGRDALTTIETLRRLEAPDGDDPRIELVAAEASLAQGAYGQALAVARRVLAKPEENYTPLLLAEARRLEGSALFSLGDLEESATAYRQAVDLYGQAEDLGRVAQTQELMANLLMHRGDLKSAEALYREAIATHRRIGSRKWLADAQNGLAFLEQVRGNLDISSTLLEEAVAVASEAGDRRREASIRDTEVWVYLQRGEWELARRGALANLALARSVGALEIEGWAHFYLAQAAFLEGDLTASETHYENAWTMAESGGLAGLSGYVLRGRAEVLLYRDRIASAQILLEDARAESSVFGEQVEAKHSFLRGRLALAEGNLESAARWATSAFEGFRRTQRREDAMQAEALLGRIQIMAGQRQAATRLLQSIETAASTSQHPMSRWGFALAWASLLETEGRIEAARRTLDEARRDARRLAIKPWELQLASAAAHMGLRHGVGGAEQELRRLDEEISMLGFEWLRRSDREASVSGRQGTATSP